MGRGRRFPCTE
ncbi:TPA: hypothetical protein N0F65_000937 [Lagenidium giganteum]|uniref:Uncharacterized protein n=1 Tax=Lagenidium giganteum TaxID=4803 RepID=A0AAV2YI53_9STRA|nr:TPA: hypothetical protein N0F65_000937 [Lagenidium giganteum]